MNNIVKCPICGTEFEGESLVDDCPYCDWTYLGCEDELGLDDYNNANRISICQAKINFSKGLDIWGEPLKKQIK